MNCFSYFIKIKTIDDLRHSLTIIIKHLVSYFGFLLTIFLLVSLFFVGLATIFLVGFTTIFLVFPSTRSFIFYYWEFYWEIFRSLIEHICPFGLNFKCLFKGFIWYGKELVVNYHLLIQNRMRYLNEFL